MYQAIVSRIVVRPHPNADRLALGSCQGFQVVVSKDTANGTLGVFFPCDGALSQDYCEYNDLFPRLDEAGVRIGGGFISEKNRRIRAQNFRGQNSEGLWMPLSSLGYIDSETLNRLNEGDTFTELDGIEICNKWINPATLRAIGEKNKTAKVSRKETPWLTMHPDTAQYKYKKGTIPELCDILITEKTHGTCVTYNTRVKLWDGSVKSMNRVRKGDIVVGHNPVTDQLEPSVVLDVMKYAPADSSWLKIYAGEKHTKDTYFNLLNCTREHQVWTQNRGWVEAQYLNSADTLLSGVQYPVINETGRQVLLGKALGDGHVDRHNNTWAVAFCHSQKQEEYLRYCHYVLGEFVTDTINTATSGYGSEMYRARTRQTPQITEMFKEWFSESSGTKEVPVNFELTPISLAFWYMDDGSLTHSDKQKDRANFAVCNFSEKSVQNLVIALGKLGIDSVMYLDSEQYYRIRLNTEAAYVMFNLIAPYIPPSMKYKLPEELRDESYVDLSYFISTEYSYYGKPMQVRSIEEDAEQHYRYDITTSTSNFIANNVLVHNSQRSGWSYETVRKPLKEFLRPLMNLPVIGEWFSYETQEYVFLNGTRRVLKETFKGDTGGYHTSNFRSVHEDALRNILPVGYQIYFEVAGWEGVDKPIMPICSNYKHSKKFVDKWGPTTTFKYGTLNGESRMYVYNVTFTTTTGQKIQFSNVDMLRMLSQWGLKECPVLDVTSSMEANKLGVNLQDRLDELLEKYTDGPSTIDSSHIREGVCLRIYDLVTGEVTFLKNKSTDFYILEDVMKSDDVVDLEELESYGAV